MTERELNVTMEEVNFLLNSLPTNPHFPEEWQTGWAQKMLAPVEREIAGGPEFRLKLWAIRNHFEKMMVKDSARTFGLTVTAGELWMLDTLLNNFDYRKVVMDSGTPVIRLAEKIGWLLLEVHANLVDERYLMAYDQPAVAKQSTQTPEEREAQLRFLAEMDKQLADAELTASGAQFEDQ